MVRPVRLLGLYRTFSPVGVGTVVVVRPARQGCQVDAGLLVHGTVEQSAWAILSRGCFSFSLVDTQMARCGYNCVRISV